MDKFIETYKGRILPICARPGMGTTALALQIADAYTQNTDKTAVIFSPRLTKEEILDRIVCQRLPFDYYGKVKKNDLSGDLQKQFASEKEKVAESKLQIVEATEMTDDGIKQTLADSDNVGLVVVDCLDAFEGRVSVATLEALATEMNVPFIVTCQIKRAVEHRINKQPKRRDIKIKELSKAQTIYFLVRKSYYDMNADNTEATLIVDSEKRTEVKLKWSGRRMKYDHVVK
jgi:replicative DNA helicase